jgi:hypothetical protein
MMAKVEMRFINLLYWFAIVGADLLVYMSLGLLLMDYKDNWEAVQGELWSLSSMNLSNKALYCSIHIWNVVNLLGIAYLVCRGYKRFKMRNIKA